MPRAMRRCTEVSTGLSPWEGEAKETGLLEGSPARSHDRKRQERGAVSHTCVLGLAQE